MKRTILRNDLRSNPNHRLGLVAMSEIAGMLVVIGGLIWSGSYLASIINGNTGALQATRTGLSDRAIYRFALDAEGKRIWTYRFRDGVVQTNLATGQPSQLLTLDRPELATTAFSHDGSTAALCGIDGTIIVYRAGETVILAQFEPIQQAIIDSSLSSDGRTFVCMSSTGIVNCWKITPTNTLEFTYDLSERSVPIRIVLDATGEQLYVAKSDGTVSIHNAETGTCSGILTERAACLKPSACFVEFAMGNDTNYFALGTSLGHIRIHDIRTGQFIREFAIEQLCASARPTAIAISPDDSTLAVASNASTDICVWRVQTGERLQPLQGHNGIIRCLQFSPASDRLYSGSYDGSIREWTCAKGFQERLIE